MEGAVVEDYVFTENDVRSFVAKLHAFRQTLTRREQAVLRGVLEGWLQDDDVRGFGFDMLSAMVADLLADMKTEAAGEQRDGSPGTGVLS
jgi:hypothetical protein